MKFFKNNFAVKFIVTLFLISLILGFLFYLAYKPDLLSYIDDFKSLITTNHQNVFLLNLGIISLIFILSLSIIGVPGIIFYIFYEGFSIGYTFGVFLVTFKLKGMLFYFLFILISKFLYIILMLYFSIMCLRFTYKLIDIFITKKREELYKTITYHFYRFIIIVLILVVNSVVIYFGANSILKLILGLLWCVNDSKEGRYVI